MAGKNIEYLQEIIDMVNKIDFGSNKTVMEIKIKLDEIKLKLEDNENTSNLKNVIIDMGIDEIIVFRFSQLNEYRYEQYGIPVESTCDIIRKLKPLGWDVVANIIKISVEKNIQYDRAMVEFFQQNDNNGKDGYISTKVIDTSITAKVKRRGAPTKEERVQKEIDNLNSDRKKMEEEKIANNFKLLTKENELLKKEIEMLKSRNVIIKGEPIFGHQAPVLGGGELNIIPRDYTVTCGIEAKTQTSK